MTLSVFNGGVPITIASTLTDQNGCFSWSGVPVGNYRIEET
eukprot:CAMPEP_0119021376 /NCGR_PEP_ID=MMETSP1176-20130426/25875_1 /TAXON_ID=265551 /ORGANISM="Synedropsis recta cf, Strain CCMP1620" /LENGTH=40 /DNA_ID= /DNA_START= /DNA_END= /DNA_ORIENTATION=